MSDAKAPKAAHDAAAQEAIIDAATARVIELEAELEASGSVTREEAELARAKAILHEWVETVTAVVATPGVGRAVLMHANGGETRISSPELPFKLAVPVNFEKREG